MTLDRERLEVLYKLCINVFMYVEILIAHLEISQNVRVRFLVVRRDILSSRVPPRNPQRRTVPGRNFALRSARD